MKHMQKVLTLVCVLSLIFCLAAGASAAEVSYDVDNVDFIGTVSSISGDSVTISVDMNFAVSKTALAGVAREKARIEDIGDHVEALKDVVVDVSLFDTEVYVGDHVAVELNDEGAVVSVKVVELTDDADLADIPQEEPAEPELTSYDVSANSFIGTVSKISGSQVYINVDMNFAVSKTALAGVAREKARIEDIGDHVEALKDVVVDVSLFDTEVYVGDHVAVELNDEGAVVSVKVVELTDDADLADVPMQEQQEPAQTAPKAEAGGLTGTAFTIPGGKNAAAATPEQQAPGNVVAASAMRK